MELQQLKISQETLIKTFQDFLLSFQSGGRKGYYEQLKGLPETGGISINVNYSDVLMYNPEIANTLLEKPEKIIKSASEALKRTISQIDPEYARYKKRFYVRFHNLPYKSAIRDLRASQIGKLVEIEGVVTQASAIQAQMITATYECRSCSSIFEVPIDEDNPSFQKSVLICPNCGRKGLHKLQLENCTFMDWQSIRLQEDHENLPPGRLPRSILCILKEDLADKVRPGDHVQLVGILKPIRLIRKGEVSKLNYSIYLEGNYVKALGEEVETEELSEEDIEKIKSLAKDPNIAERIVNSISPSIYGLSEVKKAITLLLFGGNPKHLEGGGKIRGDLNILLVGDPGTGKSQILKNVARVAPRGLYTTGKGSTAAGLTAAVVKDSLTGNWSLEAGALVLADKGVACIDEFDKMSNNDRVAIHEAMEQQTISIAKAGIVATLNARTSILAAANPAWGRYDEDRSPAENINLPVTILSRFDLIFLIKDAPEAPKDKNVAEFILKLHAGRGENNQDLIEPVLLKKYILYARKNIKPRLTRQALGRIKQFYLKLRKESEEKQVIAITPRQLEAVIRMSEARAKMELRKQVKETDAEFAINLMEEFLNQIGYERKEGAYDIDRVITGVSFSKRKRILALESLIKELYEDNGKRPVEISTVIDTFKEKHGIQETLIREDLARLKKEGRVLFPKEGYVIPLGS